MSKFAPFDWVSDVLRKEEISNDNLMENSLVLSFRDQKGITAERIIVLKSPKNISLTKDCSNQWGKYAEKQTNPIFKVMFVKACNYMS